jgi:hypothetical protein
VALGWLYDPDIEMGGGPPQPGGDGDSGGATPVNEDSMVICHGKVLRGISLILRRRIAIWQSLLRAGQKKTLLPCRDVPI